MASSRWRSDGCPRRLSVTDTPLTMNRFSNPIEPPIEYAPKGPVGWTDGASCIEALMSRLVGSVATRPCLKLVATCAVRTRTSGPRKSPPRSEEHTSELQSLTNLVCRLLLEKKKQSKRIQQRK